MRDYAWQRHYCNCCGIALSHRVEQTSERSIVQLNVPGRLQRPIASPVQTPLIILQQSLRCSILFGPGSRAVSIDCQARFSHTNTQASHKKAAQMRISPAPDVVITVFMLIYEVCSDDMCLWARRPPARLRSTTRHAGRSCVDPAGRSTFNSFYSTTRISHYISSHHSGSTHTRGRAGVRASLE